MLRRAAAGLESAAARHTALIRTDAATMMPG